MRGVSNTGVHSVLVGGGGGGGGRTWRWAGVSNMTAPLQMKQAFDLRVLATRRVCTSSLAFVRFGLFGVRPPSPLRNC